MAQLLYIKESDVNAETGKVSVKEKKVMVVRSWSNSSGAQLFLHLNGTYGYKDGAPVKDVKELSLISDPIQNKRAMEWWSLKGEKAARDFYAKKNIELEKKNMDPEEILSKVTDLDMALYIRRPKNSKKIKDFCEPQTWVEYNFKDRPPWWGLLDVAEDSQHHYRLITSEVMRQVAEEAEKEAALA